MRRLARTATLAVLYPVRYYAFITDRPADVPRRRPRAAI
jgi:hypothetical protein